MSADPREPIMQQIADELIKADSMYIFPHMVADGDALGSCASLCCLMRGLGKQADILMEDEVPDNLKFMDKDYVTIVDRDTEMPKRDLCIALDCSSLDRFPKREKMFFEIGDRTACIDHHLTNSQFAMVNLIDPMAAATAELMYELYRFMGIELNKEAGEAIYTGIVTDTGNFKYTNTTKKTHIITAELYDLGIDTKNVNITLYQNERPQKLKLHSMIMNRMEMLCGNQVAMSHVTLAMYDEAGAKTNESDGINTALRDIKGVEVGILLREMHETEIKVGFRSKEYIDVSKVCERLGGGGHKHAAGCTILKTMDEALDIVRKTITEVMEEASR
ncbi:MAG: bifunctional oligoribonuclease/PAP phosphatase NrnA [Firmicutes bacterium]|nr:bifunctional oligoribonuclease/PAP phosphatase NrnA [Bacillota bacterium]